MVDPIDVDRTEELRILAHRLLELAQEGETGSSDADKRRGRSAAEYGPEYLRLAANAIYRVRRRRSKYFDADLFGEVAWDMLLDLFIHAVDGKRVSTTSLCLAAETPVTTGLRWISHLEEADLVEREASERDARVNYVSLTKLGMERMRSFLAGECVTSRSPASFMLTK